MLFLLTLFLCDLQFAEGLPGDPRPARLSRHRRDAGGQV